MDCACDGTGHCNFGYSLCPTGGSHADHFCRSGVRHDEWACRAGTGARPCRLPARPRDEGQWLPAARPSQKDDAGLLRITSSNCVSAASHLRPRLSRLLPPIGRQREPWRDLAASIALTLSHLLGLHPEGGPGDSKTAIALASNEFDNTIVGGAGNDTLDGGDGDDILNGRDLRLRHGEPAAHLAQAAGNPLGSRSRRLPHDAPHGCVA